MTEQGHPASEGGSRRSADADARFAGLVEDRFQHLVATFPVFATFMGIHREDHRLADGTHEAGEAHLAFEKRHLAALEALDPAELSSDARFERDLALFSARRAVWDLEVHRLWERRPAAIDEVGDGVFSLLVRDFAPLTERLESVTARLEQAPRVLEEHRSRLRGTPVRLWMELELHEATALPLLFDEALATARRCWPDDDRRLRRLEAATTRARQALDEHRTWVAACAADGNDDWAIGRDRLDELVALRELDGLDADAILQIGEEQLAANREGRRAAARRLDPTQGEDVVLERIRNDHPATFDEALDAYRDAMEQAKRFIVEHDVATIPPGESLSVIATPEYLRGVLPFAAYFQPPRFDRHASGVYVVTPSVDGDPRAMREHNYPSIANTSIHEAYPGHHLQLTVAAAHPSLVRATVEAPEFVEGWAMYCEQMMREQGFYDGDDCMVGLHTDAIWRACRIILDVRMHRGEIGVDEATDFLVRETGFERPQAEAEVHRYTYTPTYQLSYLVGKVLLLRLREDERSRLGEAFSLRRFHDQLLAAGSLPISFHRRLMTASKPDRGIGG